MGRQRYLNVTLTIAVNPDGQCFVGDPADDDDDNVLEYLMEAAGDDAVLHTVTAKLPIPDWRGVTVEGRLCEHHALGDAVVRRAASIRNDALDEAAGVCNKSAEVVRSWLRENRSKLPKRSAEVLTEYSLGPLEAAEEDVRALKMRSSE